MDYIILYKKDYEEIIVDEQPFILHKFIYDQIPSKQDCMVYVIVTSQYMKKSTTNYISNTVSRIIRFKRVVLERYIEY